MSTLDRVKNTAQRAKGKLKEVVGRATGKDRLRLKGQADQAKGKAKQTGEDVKDRLTG